MKVYRHKIIARFGLMHMIGTNLSVWLNVLIQETKHEILTFYDPENRTLRISHRLGNKLAQHTFHSASHAETAIGHARFVRGLKGPHHIFECRRTNIIGTLVQDASPFLFPCTIEYSLICAAILYVMWRGICRPHQEPPVRINESLSPCKRSPHYYSVDCARAHKGLFIGILILVLTIISLILFFVLISRPEFVSLAVTEVTICELTLYGTGKEFKKKNLISARTFGRLTDYQIASKSQDNNLNCLFPTYYFSDNGNTDWYGSSAALAVRCIAQLSIGRHSVGWRSDRIIFVQHIHCDRWSFYNAKRYHFSTYHGFGVNRADSVPNNVHFGCESKKCRDGRSHETKTGTRGSIHVLHRDLQTAIDVISIFSR